MTSLTASEGPDFKEVRPSLVPVIRDKGLLRFTAWIVFAAVAAALLAAYVHAGLTRETWYDEYYTYYVTRPALGWAEAFSGHWMTDNHPPLFYALSRATGWLGDTIEARRFVNLLVLAAVAGGAYAALRSGGRHWLLALCFLIYPAMTGVGIPVFAELRSYFMSFAVVALMLLAAVLIWLDDAKPARQRSAVYAVSVFAAFNIHVTTSLIAGSMLVPFIAAALLKRDYDRFRTYLYPALFAGVFLLSTVAFQFQLWIANTSEFWIPAGFGQAWGSLVMIATFIADSDRKIMLVCVLGLGVLAVRSVQSRRLSPDLEAAVLLGIGLLIAAGLVMAVQAWRPSVIPKYLTPLVPAVCLILAIGFRAVLDTLSGLIGSVLLIYLAVMSVASIRHNDAAIANMKGWDRAASVVGRQAVLCPGTLVHVDSHWNRYVAGLQPSDNARVVPYSYRYLAKQYGFTVQPAGSRRIAADCPTLFWAQNHSQDMPTMREVLNFERSKGFRLDSLHFYHVGGGWIASTRPLDPSLVAGN
ncbi:MAG: hypothetical protein KDE55_22365 [Novosphingobium sp.]|nr:hypothetical protein [Novosphingobium sp.]